VHAGVYAAVLHYLKALKVLKSDADGKAVVGEMKKLPTDDTLFGKGKIREDGRKLHPMYLYEVKKPSESKGPWDYYKLVKEVPADQAFRPEKDGNCPLIAGSTPAPAPAAVPAAGAAPAAPAAPADAGPAKK
jgi:branched-chain amino acid transport system substrate-binding protein